jgi:hypothetical protein
MSGLVRPLPGDAFARLRWIKHRVLDARARLPWRAATLNASALPSVPAGPVAAPGSRAGQWIDPASSAVEHGAFLSKRSPHMAIPTLQRRLPWRPAWLALASLIALAACAPAPEGAAAPAATEPPPRPATVLDPQLQALDKAKAVEQQVEDQAQAQREAIERAGG